MSTIKITMDNFQKEVMENEKTVLVDFYADWCGPCQMMVPVMETIAEENQDIVVGKLNVDEEGELAMKYQVASIPTVIAFRNGQEVGREVGFVPKEAVLGILK